MIQGYNVIFSKNLSGIIDGFIVPVGGDCRPRSEFLAKQSFNLNKNKNIGQVTLKSILSRLELDTDFNIQDWYLHFCSTVLNDKLEHDHSRTRIIKTHTFV